MHGCVEKLNIYGSRRVGAVQASCVCVKNNFLCKRTLISYVM